MAMKTRASLSMQAKRKQIKRKDLGNPEEVLRGKSGEGRETGLQEGYVG